eukprot:TRINITY_DN6438_c0_g1_i2.p1 TRINITY_DN6438_c0_g1~~TRINITY_DN6438_c0_g1_i2.p1  ORF type:complete len:463 (-),score=58.71 TRINITY_DN6438_c0_g1_i2:5-1306(-)
MDEPFHIPQTQQYCQGNFLEWDQKITTLPGLYIFGVIWASLLSFLTSIASSLGIAPASISTTCSSITILRLTNVWFALGNFWIFRKLCMQTNAISAHEATKRALLMSLFPLLFFYNFLYYTDPGSTFFVMWMYLESLRNNHSRSAMLGAIAILFRQTNIIWVLFAAGSSLIRMYRFSRPPFEDNIVKDLWNFVAYIFRNLFKLLKIHFPYIFLTGIFVGFLVVNKGIVVGDRTAHAPVFNFGQFLIFLGFSFGFLCLDGQLLQNSIFGFFRTFKLKIQEGRWLDLILVLLASVACIYLIHHFMPVHPYILADNRHYTFYIWKNIFRRHEHVKFVMYPVSLLSTFSIWRLLRNQQSNLWCLLFFAATFFLLTPALLLEFRYYLAPFLMLKLNSSTFFNLNLQLGLYVLINAVTLYIFLERPYTWVDGQIARFMW